MARYIDVEPLEDKLKEHIKKTESELMLGALSTFLSVLDITPTIDAVPATIEGALGYLHKVGWMQEHDRIMAEDVAPVRHGHWIYDQCDIVCSECGTAFSDEVCYMMRSDVSYHEPKHCLWCGARMDGENDE